MDESEFDKPSANAVEQPPSNASNTHDLVRSYFHLLDDTIPIHERTPEPDATVTSLLDLLSRTHAQAITAEMMCRNDPWRFNELKEALDVSPKTLSARLGELVDVGLVSRRSYDEIPPRVEYEPTAKARELIPAFQFLFAWTDHHNLEPDDD